MKKIILILSLFITTLSAHAEEYTRLQNLWDKANFTIENKDQKIAVFERLNGLADKLVSKNPNDAEVLAWAGIIKATKAGVQNNFSSLGLLSDARELFEKSIKIDPTALNYAATMSLGSLYYQVPGWPLSFNDDEKAEELLKISLKNIPNDIEANYFYADFLLSQDKVQEAKPYLIKALNAPSRPNREIADKYRKQEIKQLLAEKYKR